MGLTHYGYDGSIPQAEFMEAHWPRHRLAKVSDWQPNQTAWQCETCKFFLVAMEPDAPEPRGRCGWPMLGSMVDGAQIVGFDMGKSPMTYTTNVGTTFPIEFFR